MMIGRNNTRADKRSGYTPRFFLRDGLAGAWQVPGAVFALKEILA
jgi:hypothetical protein